MALNVESLLKEDKELLVVDLVGDLDIYTSKNLKNVVLDTFKKKPYDIEINAENLDYIDSTGLGVLMGIYKELEKEKRKIYIINEKPNIRKIFQITELDKLFVFRGESNE